MILDHITRARAMGLPYLYLGHWVDGSPKDGLQGPLPPAGAAHAAGLGTGGMSGPPPNMRRPTAGAPESSPGASAEADPGLEEGEEGTPKMDLRVGRPVASPRFSRPGLIGRDASTRLDHRSSGPSAGPPFGGAAFGVPLAPYGRARLVVARGRMSGPSRPAPHGAFRKEPCSRGGRPSRTPPSARRGTASPPPASPGAHAAPRRRGAAANDMDGNRCQGLFSESPIQHHAVGRIKRAAAGPRLSTRLVFR